MRRFEMTEGGSSKFWEIALEGKSFTVSFGKIGAAGRTQIKSFSSPDAARTAHDALVAEKLGKGYVEKRTSDADERPLVDRLDAWLRTHRADYFAKLGRGASKAELAALEKHVGGALPPALAAFFAWRGRGSGRLFENYSTMDVDDVIDSREVQNELLEAGELDGPTWWRKDWVPFVENGGGDHLCVDLGGAFGGEPGQVLTFFHDDSRRDVLAPSFDAWLRVFVELLESGACALEKSGFFGCDEKAVAKARAKSTPGYPKQHDADDGEKAKPERKPSKEPTTSAPTMTDDAARRLVGAWCKRMSEDAKKAIGKRAGGGFYAIVGRSTELEFDPATKTLFAYKDVGVAPDTKFHDEVFRALLAKEIEKLVQKHGVGSIVARPTRFRKKEHDERNAYVLVRPFGDPSIADKAFVDALADFGKSFGGEWSLKFGWAVNDERKRRGAT